LSIKECENCKKDIVFYSNEETLCPHCSHKHSRSLKSTSLESQKVKIKKIPKIGLGVKSIKSFWAALAFFVLFSHIGAHRLYVGRIKSGLFMLVSFWGSVITYLGVFHSFFSFIGVSLGVCFAALYIYDLFSLILGNFEDSEGHFVKPD
jgi:TM2 domain-containing membrane protein YozV